ncbi:SAM-dependent methyltransferase [Calidifontibacter indicus]|uniref:SAM-dependent methyltransferase n=1 Tax=Calidifontibacter indicus TaxID=419650 RepID=UPI003D7479FC
MTAAVSGGAPPLVLTEWLCEVMPLQAGMRVLDLGSGRGVSSIFLAREFEVEVWSLDLWFPCDDRQRRANDAGVGHQVHALYGDARNLPFPRDFFDAIVAVDSFGYFATDDLFLLDLLQVLRHDGMVGIVGAGLVAEISDQVPDALVRWWEPSLWSLHTATWWSKHWSRTGLVEVTAADTMSDGWQRWLDWLRLVAPDNTVELDAVEADAGDTLGYVRVVARRDDHVLPERIRAIPVDYVAVPVNLGHTGPGPGREDR